jgi:hypothetical protein
VPPVLKLLLLVLPARAHLLLLLVVLWQLLPPVLTLVLA